MKRNHLQQALAGLFVAILLVGCPYRLPFVKATPKPTITVAPGEFAVQSGVVEAATRREGQYIQGAVSFPHAFRDDNVLATVYPVDGPGKVAVMDVNARGFTYYILATIVNVPQPDGTFKSHAEFYDGRIKWVAMGQ